MLNQTQQKVREQFLFFSRWQEFLLRYIHVDDNGIAIIWTLCLVSMQPIPDDLMLTKVPRHVNTLKE